MTQAWQEVNDACLSCHWWQERSGRRIGAMTLLLTLLVLTVLAVASTVALVRSGGHGCPPRSHLRDDRFLPPSSLLR